MSRRPTLGDQLPAELRRKLQELVIPTRPKAKERGDRYNVAAVTVRSKCAQPVANIKGTLDIQFQAKTSAGLRQGRKRRRGVRPTLPPKVKRPPEAVIPETRVAPIRAPAYPASTYNYVTERNELVRHLTGMDPSAFDPVSASSAHQPIDAAQAAELDHRLDLGRALVFPTQPKGRTPVRLVLGFDFGTSCSKLVIRAPDMTQHLAVAVPALAFARSDSHPFLWSSSVWLGKDGALELAPALGRVRVTGIKAGLMGERAASLSLAVAGGGRVLTPLAATIGFLALMIRQARGWLYATHDQLFNRGQPVWSLNLGFPAATLDSADMRRLYRTVAAAAWTLAGEYGGVTVDRCEAVAAEAATQKSFPLGLDDLQIFPEIAAAMVGFIQSYRRESGLFALVDVGATTLDVSTFTIHADREGQDRITVWLADVERFGVRPWHVCSSNVAWRDKFRRQAAILLSNLLWQTRLRRDPNNAVWKPGGELRVFRTGGGVREALHKELLEELDSWLKQHLKQTNGVRLRDLDTFADLNLGKETNADPSRLLVATGLSWPGIDFPVLTTPKDIRDVDPPQVRDFADAFIDKSKV